jgi:uncharacterized membrane protein
MQTKNIIQVVGSLLDLVGVIIIAVGTLIASATFGYRFLRARQLVDVYRPFRRDVGRAILLGLEFLVAGDIIRTVAVSPTFQSVGVLAVIVAVRTFLSFSLQVEVDGRWPWQSKNSKDSKGPKAVVGAESRETGRRPAQS